MPIGVFEGDDEFIWKFTKEDDFTIKTVYRLARTLAKGEKPSTFVVSSHSILVVVSPAIR